MNSTHKNEYKKETISQHAKTYFLTYHTNHFFYFFIFMVLSIHPKCQNLLTPGSNVTKISSIY